MAKTASDGIVRPARALISVFDKNGIADLARYLAVEFDIKLLSTGKTAELLRKEGMTVREVSDMTGFPEMMDGRLKTLHPMVHGGLLGMRDNPSHMEAMEKFGIKPIDLVVVNLYDFEEAVRKGLSRRDTIEMIDIGGPAMLRAAAKNYESVVALTDLDDYTKLKNELDQNMGGTTLKFREYLAAKVFALMSGYDAAVSTYMRLAFKLGTV